MPIIYSTAAISASKMAAACWFQIRVDREDLRRLGFEQLAWQRFGFAEAPAVWNTGKFTDQQSRYLAYHREAVFVSAPI
ncbi:MAG: hypothetical protein R3F55_24530 [Alphaproteobacteria bacterium]